MAEVLSLLGAFGGAAGFLALYMQFQDRRARRKVAHLPPELRPVLLEIADVASQVESSPRDTTWVRENLTPMRERYEVLYKIATSKNKLGDSTWGMLYTQLQGIETYAGNDLYGHDAAKVSRNARKQEEAATEAARLARELLHRLSGV